MTAEEITFKVAYDGPLTDFSRDHPDVALALWCDWRKEVVQVAGAGAEHVERLRSALAPEPSRLFEAYPLDERTHVIVADCIGLPHDDVNEAVHATHCLNLPPTRFESGNEVYQIVSFTEAKSRALFKRLRESGRRVELVAKRPLRVQPALNARGSPASALFDGLTERQVDALLLAHRHGLYASPRRTTAASIASAVGLSRSTFEEHVRKAEQRVVANLVPYLELHAKALRARAGSPPAPPRE